MDLFVFFFVSFSTLWFLLSIVITLAVIYFTGSYVITKMQGRAGAKRLMKRHADS